MNSTILIVLAIAAFGYMSSRFIAKMTGNKIIDEKRLKSAKSIHPLSVQPLRSQEFKSLSEYKGRPLLIVNTASKCMLTPQFKELQTLHEEYKDQGLSVLGFPSNDFRKQEPGSSSEIQEFCQLNYGVTFDMFEKVKVKAAISQMSIDSLPISKSMVCSIAM